MQIVIFGATGTLGSHLVEQALSMGYSVTAFTRNSSKLEGLRKDNLKFIEGDIFNQADVDKAVEGQDAVICALGDGRKGRVRAIGTAHIIKAMNTKGCKRLICQTTLGLGDSWNNLNFFWKYIMFGWFLKKAFQDHERQEKVIVESAVNYTIVRPSAFTDGGITDAYRINFDGSVKNLKLNISRADIAKFMLKQLSSGQFHKKTVSISN